MSIAVYSPSVGADDHSSSASPIVHGESMTSWICSPDCGDEPSDEVDWYSVTMSPKEVAQFFVFNTGDYSDVTLNVSLYVGAGPVLLSSIEVDDHQNESVQFTNNESFSEQYFIQITTVDGWYDDGTNYTATLNLESDNHWTLATPIEIGTYVDENMVCIESCSGNLMDAEDWYTFSVIPNQSIGIVAEELSWFTLLDFEMFELTNGVLESFTYHYAGGSAGGDQDYSVRAWFNTTEAKEVFLRVHTNDSDDVIYNLSVSSGTWVDVVEDEYHWVSFPDLKLGDVLRVQAIRTDDPNDLDILLFNATEFEHYRAEVVNNETTTPSELLAEEDCLVCSISFDLTPDKAGMMGVKPSMTHDIHQTISWSPTLVLVADYTDYRQNPPSGSTIDIASVFLSVTVLESQPSLNEYEVYENISNQWVMVDSGTTFEGMISSPADGWNSTSTMVTTHGSHSQYRVIVREQSTGLETTNSTFEVTNQRPEACLDLDGSFGGEFTENVPVKIDASCSSDRDGDGLSHQWTLDGVLIEEEGNMDVFFDVGQHTVSLTVEDTLGLEATASKTFNVSTFPSNEEYQSVNLSSASSTTVYLHGENRVYDNTSVAPEWLNFGVIGTEIGLGLSIESRIVQNTTFVLELNHENNQTSIIRQHTNSTTETALKVNLAVFLKDIESGIETPYDLPMPMKEPVYEGQPWFPVGLFDRVYYWGDLAVVNTTEPSSVMNALSQVDIEIGALDLMKYIESVASYIPGSQVPLLVLGVAVDYNLFLDIDLQLAISNNGSIAALSLTGEGAERLQTISATVSHSENQTVQLQPYSLLDSSILVYGGIGLRLRIAQPAWLTTGLGFFYEDPMFLEGIWEYTIVESSDPIASSTGRNGQLTNTSIYVFATNLPQPDSVTNESSNQTQQDNQTNDTNPMDNSSQNEQNASDGSTEGPPVNENGDVEEESPDPVVPDVSESSSIDTTTVLLGVVLSLGLLVIGTVVLLIRRSGD